MRGRDRHTRVVSNGGSMLRWSALLGAGALVLHELQYRVSFGPGADAALAAHGHAYLSGAIALVSVLAGLAVIRLLAEVGRARRGALASARRAPASLPRRWIWSSAALATTYLLQEGLEGQLAPGHPGVLHAVGPHHGWVALLVAVVLGLLVACLMRGAEAIVALARRGAHVRRGPRARGRLVRSPAAPCFPRLEVLARHLAGRAPPLASA